MADDRNQGGSAGGMGRQDQQRDQDVDRQQNQQNRQQGSDDKASIDQDGLYESGGDDAQSGAGYGNNAGAQGSGSGEEGTVR